MSTTKPNIQTIHLGAIINGHLIGGTVTFAPAPQPGIMTQLAEFEARRIVADMVAEEILAGRL